VAIISVWLTGKGWNAPLNLPGWSPSLIIKWIFTILLVNKPVSLLAFFAAVLATKLSPFEEEGHLCNHTNTKRHELHVLVAFLEHA
jgi:hypothetical protein